MKIKLLLGTCLLVLLSGCMTVGYIVESSIKNAFKGIPNYWYLKIDGYNRGRGYLTHSWTSEPSQSISFQEISKLPVKEMSFSYPGNYYPNRYLNVFHVESKNGITNVSHSSFDIKTLMQNKSIMYGELELYYEKNIIELIYREANLGKKLYSSPSNGYYASKSDVVLDSKPLNNIK